MAGFLGFNQQQQNKPVIYSGINLSSSRANLGVPIGWGQFRVGTNAIWYNGFTKHKQSAKGKGGGKGGQQYTYSADTICALLEGTIDSIVRIWQQGSTTTTATLSQLNQTFFNGSATQAPWSYVTSKFPSQARSYAYTAYVGTPQMDLGNSATIPDNQYEVVRTAGFAYTHTTANGWIDPNSHTQYSAIDVMLSDCITDLFTNTQYGFNFSPSDLGDMTQYATYQRAMGLFFSPLLNTQTKATDVINRWAQGSHSWIYWDGVQYRFVPLGDETVTGNGVTYTPQVDVAYDLSVANGDFLGDVPIKVTIKDPADCPNNLQLSITDRTLGYISNPIPWVDPADRDLKGLRDAGSVSAEDIKDPAVALIVAQLIGKRGLYVRRTYEFRASYRLIRLLPGTTLTLTDPNIGINKLRVRVASVKRNTAGDLTVTCEEFPAKVHTYQPVQGVTVNTTTYPNEQATPSSVNTPAVIEPASSYTGGKSQLIVAASGQTHWGGCRVWLSFDGSSFQNIGEITEPAMQGTLTAALASHADPDTTNTLSVDCTESGAVPESVTHADADALRTLCYVSPQPASNVLNAAGELMAFGTVTPTGTYTANLTYLRRGAYGTAPSAHSIGDQFTVINVLGNSGTSVTYDLPAAYVGKTLYLKFTSFNEFGEAEQDISTVVEYTYTPTGAGYGTGAGGVPATPTGLSAIAAGIQSATINWSANIATDNVTGYQVWRAPGLGASFGSAALVATVNSLTWTDTGLAAATGYTYFLVAMNAVGTSAPTAGVNLTTATTVGNTYRLQGALDGAFDPSKEIFDIPMNGDEKFPGNLVGSIFKFDGVPASTKQLPIKVNGTQVGYVQITSGGVITMSLSGGYSAANGDRLRLEWPSPFDTGLTGIHFLFLGTR